MRGKIIKNIKGGIIDSEAGSLIDVIDKRGFVDGVKVARKCSRANFLGKAVYSGFEETRTLIEG